MGNRVQIDIPYFKLEEFCKRWDIIEFSLFGSAIRDDYRQESDVDVLVKFAPETNYSLFDLVHMEDELKQIFGREVDLVEKKSVEQSENYIRRKTYPRSFIGHICGEMMSSPLYFGFSIR